MRKKSHAAITRSTRGLNGYVDGVSPRDSSKQTLDKTQRENAPNLDAVASIAHRLQFLGAPVMRGFSRKPNGRGFLTVAEVAKVLGLSRATVYRLCKEGVIPSVKLLNSIRVQTEQLDAALRTE
jgi:excisionase family DNA binding protein